MPVAARLVHRGNFFRDTRSPTIRRVRLASPTWLCRWYIFRAIRRGDAVHPLSRPTSLTSRANTSHLQHGLSPDFAICIEHQLLPARTQPSSEWLRLMARSVLSGQEISRPRTRKGCPTQPICACRRIYILLDLVTNDEEGDHIIALASRAYIWDGEGETHLKHTPAQTLDVLVSVFGSACYTWRR